VRVNYEKCEVALRSQDLVEFAHKRIGETTALVYGEVLRIIEDKIPRCQLDPNIDDPDEVNEGPTISTMELSTAMDPLINVATGIGKVSHDKIDTSSIQNAQPSRKRKADEAEVVGDASSDEGETGENGDGMDVDYSAKKRANGNKVTFQDQVSSPEDRQNRMNQIKNHLMLLAADKAGFLKRIGNQGLGQYTIEFEPLISRLKESELDAIIHQRFGDHGLRLTRVLRDKGKLDEKQMLTFGMIKQKDIRTKMTEMHMAGFADIQEVPKDAARTPGRTIFLWYFDAARVETLVLDSIYKTMARHYQVMQFDKIEAAEAIALSKRTDVKSVTLEEIIPAHHLKKLEWVRIREEKLLGQVARLDQLIGMFRDY
jgi:DNA-directed RNA polymerase III subunit RPC3